MIQDQGLKVFAVKHKEENVRANSRSGGIFTALSDAVLNEKGIVYGCILNEKFEAKHYRADNYKDRDLMRGSKYIQSDVGIIFQDVAKDLKAGKKVLFSGTSCQIAGLKSFLQKEYENLLCVDIVCHGVPSPLVWKEYLKWQERKVGKIFSVDFRNKKDFGWADHVETLTSENGGVLNSRIFTSLFYGHHILRPSCYKCPYKDITHPGDITIADYWGIDKAAPGFNDNKGVSLVLINNIKGKEIFDNVKEELIIQETNIKDSLQPPLIKPFDEPKGRENFWKYFYKNDFSKVAKKYGTTSLSTKIKRKLKYIFKQLQVR